MASNNSPPRPPWFREPPGGNAPRGEPLTPERPRPESPGGGAIIAGEGESSTPPQAPPVSPTSPVSPAPPVSPTSTPDPASESPPAPAPAPAGRFPVRPEPHQVAPPPSFSQPPPPPPSENRQASLEARMIALEHDYAQSAESWRESSLAMVRALEILESRIGPDTGQPLGGMGEGEISSELSALRTEIAQLRTRIDGFLPPPAGQGFGPPRSPSAGAPFGTPHQGPVYQGAPPRPARLQRHAGRTILSLLITSAAIILAWFAATHFDSIRDATLKEGFRRAVGGVPEVSIYRPPAGKFTRLPTGEGKTLTPFGHYEKALRLYRSGRGVQDMTRAAAHFDAAASQGMAAAQFWLGYFYEKGLGVEASAALAAKLYGQAAAKGHIKAMHNLGVLYLEGRGVEYDVASASEWLLRSSSYGFSESMNLLGYINEEGMLGARNIKYAYAWYRLAAQMGHRGAQEHAPRIVMSLSRRDRREAATLVNGWRVHEVDPVVNGTITAMKLSQQGVSSLPSGADKSRAKNTSKNVLGAQSNATANYAAPYVAPSRPSRPSRPDRAKR